MSNKASWFNDSTYMKNKTVECGLSASALKSAFAAGGFYGPKEATSILSNTAYGKPGSHPGFLRPQKIYLLSLTRYHPTATRPLRLPCKALFW